MSLTNPTNVVTEQRLAEFYQAIFPYLGGYGGTGIDYTETERVVGTWVNGKPIYQKVIDGLSVTMSWDGQYRSFANITYDASTIEDIIYCAGIYNNSSIPQVYALGCEAANNKSKLTVYGVSGGTINKLIIQYTKTTDTAGTKKYLGVPAVHYTTDEQVIGTWIDGKPLYQKTVSISFPRNDTKTSLGITGVDMAWLNFDGSFVYDARYGETYGMNLSWAGSATGTPCMLHNESGNLKIRFNRILNDFVGLPCYITIQYTKTTD